MSNMRDFCIPQEKHIIYFYVQTFNVVTTLSCAGAFLAVIIAIT